MESIMPQHPHIKAITSYTFKPFVSKSSANFDNLRNFDLQRPAVVTEYASVVENFINTVMIGAADYKTLQTFVTPRQLSAHFWVAQNGEIYQLVDPEHRAWFAGKTAYGPEVKLSVLGDTKLPCLPARDGAEACKNPVSISLNDYAISVWFETADLGSSYSADQIASGINLLAAIRADYPATADTTLVSYNAGRVMVRGYEEVRPPIHELNMATDAYYAAAYTSVADVPETCLEQGGATIASYPLFEKLGFRISVEQKEAAELKWFHDLVHVFHQDTHATVQDCLTERDMALLAALTDEKDATDDLPAHDEL
jgi:hypothetical protein